MIGAYELRVLRLVADLTVNGKAPDYAAIAEALRERKHTEGDRMPLSTHRLESALANLEDAGCLHPQTKGLLAGLQMTHREARERRTFRVTNAGLAVLKHNE